MNAIVVTARARIVASLITMALVMSNCDRAVSPQDQNPAARGLADAGATSVLDGVTTQFGDAIATSQISKKGILTTLRDSKGTLVASLSWLRTTQSLHVEVAGGIARLDAESMGGNFNPVGCNHAVYLYWQLVASATAAASVPDGQVKPVCAILGAGLDSQCILLACKEYAACSAKTRCGTASWLGLQNADCSACNAGVIASVAQCSIETILPR